MTDVDKPYSRCGVTQYPHRKQTVVFNNTIYFLGIPRSNILRNEGYLVSLMVAEPAGYGTISSLYNENNKTTRNQPTNGTEPDVTAAGLDLRPVVLPFINCNY